MRSVEELNDEISECHRCIDGLFRTMRSLGVPDEKMTDNIMVKAYIKRLQKAEDEKELLLQQT